MDRKHAAAAVDRGLAPETPVQTFIVTSSCAWRRTRLDRADQDALGQKPACVGLSLGRLNCRRWPGHLSGPATGRVAVAEVATS
jgi:hypothetical protein